MSAPIRGICPECNSAPCWWECATQQMPDTLSMKANRANLTPLEWIAKHADLLDRYPDSVAARQARALLAEAGADQGRRIWGPDALAAVLPVAAGTVAADEVVRPAAHTQR